MIKHKYPEVWAEVLYLTSQEGWELDEYTNRRLDVLRPLLLGKEDIGKDEVRKKRKGKRKQVRVTELDTQITRIANPLVEAAKIVGLTSAALKYRFNKRPVTYCNGYCLEVHQP